MRSRNDKIVARVLNGEPCRAVAEDFGISGSRVREIVCWYCVRKNKKAHEEARAASIERTGTFKCFASLVELRQRRDQFA